MQNSKSNIEALKAQRAQINQKAQHGTTRAERREANVELNAINSQILAIELATVTKSDPYADAKAYGWVLPNLVPQAVKFNRVSGTCLIYSLIYTDKNVTVIHDLATDEWRTV